MIAPDYAWTSPGTDALALAAAMREARDAEEVERFRAMLREVSP